MVAFTWSIETFEGRDEISKALTATAEVEAVKASATALSNASMKIGQAMYKKGDAGAAGPTGA
jgi:hypothetical protein